MGGDGDYFYFSGWEGRVGWFEINGLVRFEGWCMCGHGWVVELELCAAVVCHVEGRAGRMGCVKDIVTGCNVTGGEGIVEKAAIGLLVVADEDCLDRLSVESVVSVTSEDLFDMGNTEKRDEFSPVRFRAVDFEVWGGYVAVVEADGHVVGYLDGILDGEEPKFHGEVVFGKVVTCYGADVFPICFGEAILVLALAWRTSCDCEVFVKEFFNNATDEFEVSVG